MAELVPFPETARAYLRAFDAHRDLPTEGNFIARQVALDGLLFHEAWTPAEQLEYLERLQANRRAA